MSFLSKTKTFIVRHKIISSAVVIVLITGGYFLFNFFNTTSAVTKYVLTKVEKGTIVSSLSSSGSVSALNQIDIKAKASGQVVYVGAKAGQNVSAGQLLAQLDTTDAKRAITTAEQNLQSAQISLQRLVGQGNPSVPLNKQDATDALNQSYESGYNSVSSTFIDLPTIMTDLHDILYGTNLTTSLQQNIDFYTYSANIYNQSALQFKDSITKSYKIALDSYNKNFTDYKSTSRFSDTATIDSLINETYETTKNVAQAIKDANNLIQFYKDTLAQVNIKPIALADTYLATLNSDSGKTNSDIVSLLNIQSTIKSNKDALANTDLDTQSQQLSVQKAEDALAQAKQDLGNYFVYAPFAGIIATMNAKVSDTAPSTIATIVSKTMTADISFGETDIAKIKMDQKATLTFDAVADLTITGKVSQIDTIGTNSQGVVSYNVKIVMDVQDDRIKPGMSTTAVVITDTKTDALYVPNSAIKTQQGTKYVLKATSETDASPTKQTVETGVSDDTSTEITSGLSEGDVIVSGTISSTTAKTASTSSSASVRIPGLTGGAGPGR